MRIKDNGNSVVLWLSRYDTEDWATRPGESWPCSQLRGRRLVAAFDSNGLYDLRVDGKDAQDDLDCNELNAITSDYLGQRLKPGHPCYLVTVGQFKGGS